MDHHELTLVLAEIDRIPATMKRRVIHLIRTLAPTKEVSIDTLEMEAASVPEEAYHVIYYMMTKRILPHNDAYHERIANKKRVQHKQTITYNDHIFLTLLWFVQIVKPGGRQFLKENAIRPCAASRTLMDSCRSVVLHPPVCVRPSMHFGSSVGDGVFALIPFQRGQMIMNFTGRIHKLNEKGFMIGKRPDYILSPRYLGREFIIDPLDDTHQFVQPPHYSGYINEPSAPPFPHMSNARHNSTGRVVLVRRYDYAKGYVVVEFSDGRRESVIPEDLSTDDTRRMKHLPYRANCMWYDFPVPLEELYRRVSSNPSTGVSLYKRTKRHSCTVTIHSREQMVAVFEGHTNQVFSFEMHASRWEKLAMGDVVTLREEQMEGLRRHGVVTRVSAESFDVYFRVDPKAAPMLPQTVRAGTVGDYDVPFPSIHACKKIEIGEELLCLYAEPMRSRGLHCKRKLTSVTLPWYEYVE